MNFWEYLSSRHEQLLADAWQHASAVFQCMVLATLIGVLIGVVTYRSNWAGNLATTATSTILTIPSLAMIGLLVPIVGLGVPPTVIALTLYGLLPIVRNSIVGLRGVDPTLVDAARGIGMSGGGAAAAGGTAAGVAAHPDGHPGLHADADGHRRDRRVRVRAGPGQ
ncbi:hypothetical protein GCM10020256_48130 [Streptomyces thermocoprophilus]